MSSTPKSPRVLVIGTGFGGIGMAIQLLKAGYTQLSLLEKEAELGGCWRDNRYPGAACDVPSHLYSYSFEPKSDWSRKYAPQAEILAYLQHCARKYGVRERIHFNAEVVDARYDAGQALWTVQLKNGESLQAEVLISACGQLNRPAYPKLKGIERFRGAQFHSARWDHGVDLQGKRVAVIGTGASAIQFVPQIVPKVEHLSLFQRSAPYVIPKPDRAYGALDRTLFRRLPGLLPLSRAAQYCLHETRALGFTRYSALMALPKWGWQRFLRREVEDLALRDRLLPDYPLGCKRILLANDYYAALARPNAEVVTEAIREVSEKGVITADGVEHPADVLIYGTGFQALDFLAPMRVHGLGGLDLNQAWKDGAEAYLGVTVSGFPNLFLLYGPNTNLGHSSIVYMLESQIHYVMEALKLLRRRGAKALEVKPDVQQQFNARLQERIGHTVWNGGCTSWYKTESGKNTNNWPGYTFEYRRATRRLRAEDYRLA
jgi:cation diffusion facilitator CzcD-associated flavoprotein CzcO